jgi:hypothetical protein
MFVRALAAGVAALAVLATAPTAGAVTGRITVTPASPLVGAKASIAVQVTARSNEKPPAVLYLKVTSPRGGALRVRLTRTGAGTWRTIFVFADQGRWRLSVVAGIGGSPPAGTALGSSSVLVRKR